MAAVTEREKIDSWERDCSKIKKARLYLNPQWHIKKKHRIRGVMLYVILHKIQTNNGLFVILISAHT